jgi:hypothetical protein
VRYRSYLTRDELVARFGSKKGKEVKLDYTPKGGERDEDKSATADAYKKAIVHEVWDKRKLEVVWLAPGTADMILDKQPDPLKLNGFFPNPDPLLATTTTGVGHFCIICRIASSPSMRGIRISMVMTSGDSSRTLSKEMRPSSAMPTTSIAGSIFNAVVMIRRMIAESSTTKTRILGSTIFSSVI